jgi:hypothetical protein
MALWSADTSSRECLGQTGTMANLRVHSDRLEVELTSAEKALGLRRDHLVVDRDDIRSAIITDDPWIWIRGIRSRGMSVPLTIAVGVWKNHGGKDFVVVKAKRRAVVLDLDDSEFTRLIISTNRAAELIESLKLADAEPPADD